jgi:hypothetical protein
MAVLSPGPPARTDPGLANRWILQRFRATCWIALPDLPAGCPILGASFELEAREGSVRDYLVKLQRDLRDRMAAAVKEAANAGELGRTTDAGQLLFELRGVPLAFHQELHLLRSPSAVRTPSGRWARSWTATPRPSQPRKPHAPAAASPPSAAPNSAAVAGLAAPIEDRGQIVEILRA